MMCQILTGCPWTNLRFSELAVTQWCPKIALVPLFYRSKMTIFLPRSDLTTWHGALTHCMCQKHYMSNEAQMLMFHTTIFIDCYEAKEAMFTIIFIIKTRNLKKHMEDILFLTIITSNLVFFGCWKWQVRAGNSFIAHYELKTNGCFCTKTH